MKKTIMTVVPHSESAVLHGGDASFSHCFKSIATKVDFKRVETMRFQVLFQHTRTVYRLQLTSFTNNANLIV